MVNTVLKLSNGSTPGFRSCLICEGYSSKDVAKVYLSLRWHHSHCPECTDAFHAVEKERFNCCELPVRPEDFVDSTTNVDDLVCRLRFF